MKPPVLVFMLTVNDRTVAQPAALLSEVLASPLEAIGIKETGVPPERIEELLHELAGHTHRVYLEVMTDDPSECLHLVEAAGRARISGVLGTRNTTAIGAAIRASRLEYFPILDDQAAYSRTLEDDISPISKMARRQSSDDHVTGILLNPYRIACNPILLTKAVKSASGKPVFATGSINSLSRLEILSAAGADLIGIGSSIIECTLAPGSMSDQIRIAHQTLHQQRNISS